MSEAPDERKDRPATERAEELVDRMGRTIAHVASLAALRMRKVTARAREEAEDVWAEAQSIRHRERS
jgi:hypothetical protein